MFGLRFMFTGTGAGWGDVYVTSLRKLFPMLLTTDTSHVKPTQSKFEMTLTCMSQVLGGLGRHRR